MLLCQISRKFLKPTKRFSKGLAFFRSCDQDAAKLFRLVSPFPLVQKTALVKLDDSRRSSLRADLTLSARVLSNAFSSTFMRYIVDFLTYQRNCFSASELYILLVCLVHIGCMNVSVKDSDKISFSGATFVFQDSAIPRLIGGLMIGDMRDEGGPTLFF